MDTSACTACRSDEPLGFDFTFAFQPIVDMRTRSVFAYEALVRGLDGGGAATILSKVNDGNRYRFDQLARVRAIELASALFPPDGAKLSVNILPNAVYDPIRCLRTTLKAARDTGFSTSRLMFEFTEQEKVTDTAHLDRIARTYAEHGFITAIDDFGAGFAGLGFLAEFVPHVLKLDRELVRGIDRNRTRQAILLGLVSAAKDLGCALVAEGVEEREEFEFLRSTAAIDLYQGYYFARPAFRALPAVDWDRIEGRTPAAGPAPARPVNEPSLA